MRPKRLILVRHGESQGNVDKHAYATIPDHSLALTEAGVQQAIEAGQKIRQIIGEESVHFWVSPYRRTRQTFENILKAFSVAQVKMAWEHWGLREQDWGHYRECEASEILEQERDRYGANFYRFPNGESVADVWDRQGGVIATLFRDFNNPDYTVENVVLVTHGRTMRAFCTRFFHWSIEYSEHMGNPKNCEIWVIVDRIKASGKAHFELTTKPRMHEDVPPINDLLAEFRKR